MILAQSLKGVKQIAEKFASIILPGHNPEVLFRSVRIE
jgi:hypothetical protein